MLIIGLTGSIGMGKSTAGQHLKGRGLAVFDADRAVHQLYRSEAVPLIAAAFPGTVAEGQVDRHKLADAIKDCPAALRRLEAIVHPLVRKRQWRFLQQQKARGTAMAVLDIPLLFETGAAALVDATIVVSAPAAIQRARVRERPGMTAAKLDAILARQLSDAEKRARADFVVDTGGALGDTYRQLDNIVESLRTRAGTAYERWRALFAPDGGC